MLTVAHPLPQDEDETLTVVVEVRGNAETIRWHPDRVEGHPSLLSRLGHPDVELTDPVVFLDAVRSCFGDRAEVRVKG